MKEHQAQMDAAAAESQKYKRELHEADERDHATSLRVVQVKALDIGELSFGQWDGLVSEFVLCSSSDYSN